MAAATLQVGRVKPLDFVAFLLLVLAAVATLAPRRTAPVWALAAAMVVVSTYLLLGYPVGPVQLCLIIATFQVARRRPLRVSVPACGLAAVVASGTIAARLLDSRFGALGLFALVWTAWVVVPWSLGALLHVLAATRERARQELVARVALEERMKIASEVHDVAGHGFAVVAMQAGVALLVFDEQPAQVRKSIEAIQAISAKSLTDLRGMLDTFHPAEHGGTDLVVGKPESVRPATGETSSDTGLAGLAELVEQVRAGGLPVELEIEPMDTALAEDIDMVSYRVVQESLTNVLRHAGPTTAEVRISRDHDDLLIQVRDHGVGCPHGDVDKGRGLTGMRARVEAVGGKLAAGPAADEGFLVTARLPLSAGAR
ncbi:MAG TPA: sensor histidine kinase [Pseudonocardiaceae bacterium]|jgi:signal transduction histidine kinase|nr:sensor histidine kinase [Pseudonocardiaceae bacterium]